MFYRAITSKKITSRLNQLKIARPDVEVLFYMLGDERFLEWAHSAGVSVDETLREASLPVPPESLRSIVAAPTEAIFLWTGIYDANLFLKIFTRHTAAKDRITLLDFGCGCGRMTRFLSLAPGLDVHATDVNPLLTAWCSDNIPNAKTLLNGTCPPLVHPKNSFDLIYSLSIFTHLSLSSSRAWLGEMCRLLKPEGILILTTHGYPALDVLVESEQHQQMFSITESEARGIRMRLNVDGFIHLRYSDHLIQVANAGNDYGSIFTDQDFMRGECEARGLQILEFIPGGLRAWQDVTVLRKEC